MRLCEIDLTRVRGLTDTVLAVIRKLDNRFACRHPFGSSDPIANDPAFRPLDLLAQFLLDSGSFFVSSDCSI